MWPFKREKEPIENAPDAGRAPSTGRTGERTGTPLLSQTLDPTQEENEPLGKVLLLDTDEEVDSALRALGWAVSRGSLGRPYQVPQDDNFLPVIPNHALPGDWAENDLVVVDLGVSEVRPHPEGEKVTSDGELDWWAKCSRGVIDPRPRTARMMRPRGDRMYRHGTGFIVFLSPAVTTEFVIGSTDRYSRFSVHKNLAAAAWDFVGVLDDYLTLGPNTGKEVQVAEGADLLADALRPHLGEASFDCTLTWRLHESEAKAPTILVNRFGEAVGAMTNYKAEDGFIVLLPRFERAAPVVESLCRDVLPYFLPKLFPTGNAARWLRDGPYEHPAITDIRREMIAVREDADAALSALERRSEQIREERAFLHELLTGTGEELRQAVSHALEYVGFEHVVDADDQLATEPAVRLEEDLRIEDRSPTLLVEVKGILGRPSDEDALQVGKYLAPRMREEARTDIQGLTVINHERHRPPLERTQTDLFRDLVVTNAEEQGIGLMTGWDLFRVARNMETLGWPPESAKDLFYQVGLVDVVPSHYRYVGRVVKVWPEASALGVQVENGEVTKGACVAIEGHVVFTEGVVESLQMDDTEVELANEGDGVGVRLAGELTEVHVGARVFAVDMTTKKLRTTDASVA